MDKRVSTLKSLAPKKNQQGTIRNKVIDSKKTNEQNDTNVEEDNDSSNEEN